MRTFKSIYLDNKVLPDDSSIYEAIEQVGYNGFLPRSFLADMLILSREKILKIERKEYCNEYIKALSSVINTSGIQYWVIDTMYLLKRIGQKHDLRIIEQLASNGNAIEFSSVPFSFNYAFDIKNLDSNVIKLLDITKEQIDEIEKLPEDVIDVLTIANGLGSFLKTSKRIVASEKQMQSYGDVIKIHKHNFADPLFNYKFSVKNYDVDSDKTVANRSNRIVIGYFLGNYKRQGIVETLMKLLGTILLGNFSEGVNVIVYSFLIDTYSKRELTSIEDIISYFAEVKQLKLFPIDNSKAIKTMVTENPGDDIIYLPNILGSCYLDNNHSGPSRVNIISVQESFYNSQYSNVCKKTGGTFVII